MLDVLSFLQTLPPFQDLQTEALTSLAERFTPLRYTMGQAILNRNQGDRQIILIYEGQVRILGSDPVKNTSVTLDRQGAGTWLGVTNWLRGVTCETALASTETICLSLREAEWDRFWQAQGFEHHPWFRQVALTELYSVVGEAVVERAQTNGNLKPWLHKLQDQIRVEWLLPGTYGPEQGAIAFLDDRQWCWLLSGGQLDQHQPGALVERISGQGVTVPGDRPARLLGVPLTLWQEMVGQETPVPAIVPQVLPPVLDTESLEAIPYAPPLQTPAQTIVNNSLNPEVYPFVRGKGPVGSPLACAQMLTRYFGTRFRGETIKRAIEEQWARQGTFSLATFAMIADGIMGLHVQIAQLPAAQFHRLEAPVVVQWQESITIVYAISDRHVVIAHPEIGCVKRDLQDFLASWGEGGEVLLVRRQTDTPEERFGIRWFIPAIKRHRKVLLEVFLASFFVQLFALANPLVIQIIIDKVIVQKSLDTLNVFGILLLILAIFEAFLGALRMYLFTDTTNRIDMSLGSEIIDHLLRLPLRYFSNRPVGEISTRINELENIRQFLTGRALSVVLDAVFSVIYIVVMFFYSPLLSFCALGVIPLFVTATAIFTPVFNRQLRTRAERNAKTQSYLVEVMGGIQTVKAQNIELRSRWRWQENYASYVQAGFQTAITATLSNSVTNFLNKLSGILVLWVGIYLVLNEELTLGGLIAFRIIAGYVTSPILNLTQLWQNFQETALSLERLADIVDYPQEAEADRNNIMMPLIQGRVTYENIAFRFSKEGPLQLQNINLDFAPGTFVAIVGESGAGKSTLTKLLPRLYEPEQGRVLIDGYDVRKVELYSLRRQIGFVPQDILLFEGTVRDNIALTNPEATDEEVIAAAQIAAAHEFIMNDLGNGYNTTVGERGAALSGGQRQRIAIARSVLQRPRILVLDEATNALDYTTEFQVCTNLKAAFRDTTVLFITHRLGTVQDADVIIMMDKGAVVEQGTHQELLALQGRYARLYHQQSAYQ